MLRLHAVFIQGKTPVLSALLRPLGRIMGSIVYTLCCAWIIDFFVLLVLNIRDGVLWLHRSRLARAARYRRQREHREELGQFFAILDQPDDEEFVLAEAQFRFLMGVDDPFAIIDTLSDAQASPMAGLNFYFCMAVAREATKDQVFGGGLHTYIQKHVFASSWFAQWSEALDKETTDQISQFLIAWYPEEFRVEDMRGPIDQWAVSKVELHRIFGVETYFSSFDFDGYYAPKGYGKPSIFVDGMTQPYNWAEERCRVERHNSLSRYDARQGYTTYACAQVLHDLGIEIVSDGCNVRDVSKYFEQIPHVLGREKPDSKWSTYPEALCRIQQGIRNAQKRHSSQALLDDAVADGAEGVDRQYEPTKLAANHRFPVEGHELLVSDTEPQARLASRRPRDGDLAEIVESGATQDFRLDQPGS